MLGREAMALYMRLARAAANAESSARRRGCRSRGSEAQILDARRLNQH